MVPSPSPLFSPCYPLQPLSSPSPCTMQVENGNHLIRRLVLSSGVVSPLAGLAGSIGSTNGVGTNARFTSPIGIALDAAGTFAVVVRREGRGTIQEGIRLERGMLVRDGDLDVLLGASE